MDILLPQIKAFLISELDFVRRSDVCLTPNPGVIPEAVGFPYVGIKDGNVTNHELPGDTLLQELLVEIYIYDRLGRDDRNIQSLHEKCRVVRELLREWDASGAVADVEPTSEIPVNLLYTRKGLVIRKGLRFKFERED